MNTKRYYMMGIPESGKTTFLVAFTFMLEDQTEGTRLHLNPSEPPEGMTKEFKEEMDHWGKFEPLTHTRVGQIHKMKYTLYDEKEERYILEIPDRYGEIFSNIVLNRYIEDETREEWLAADKILFFVNLKRMNIGSQEELLTELPQEMQQLLKNGKESLEKKKDADKKFILPDQFMLVELLQMLQEIRKNGTFIKFIISAWDSLNLQSIDYEKQLPEIIFEKYLPFVYQFLKSNSNSIKAEFWGVSAQGSDLLNKEEIKKMSQALDSMERVIVVDSKGEVSHDLSKIFIE